MNNIVILGNLVKLIEHWGGLEDGIPEFIYSEYIKAKDAVAMAMGYNETISDSEKITVCDKCLKASCLKGIFLCDESRSVGTVEKTVKELKKLMLENSCYWEGNQ